eukprot:NODE_1684_length_1443_cov_21.336442_g1520_i0.p1 GENE.NODE_1684_length_1443_cov_21.336442_g1520_i0~~NODE_1684_length_1443_cov_21.336442_g1520_i0.p1  ORF type:complete len:290 (-),score=30.69 NODE_1684_length_1443_cov_21.336442_g1520_i0:508-1377(-)
MDHADVWREQYQRLLRRLMPPPSPHLHPSSQSPPPFSPRITLKGSYHTGDLSREVTLPAAIQRQRATTALKRKDREGEESSLVRVSDHQPYHRRKRQLAEERQSAVVVAVPNVEPHGDTFRCQPSGSCFFCWNISGIHAHFAHDPESTSWLPPNSTATLPWKASVPQGSSGSGISSKVRPGSGLILPKLSSALHMLPTPVSSVTRKAPCSSLRPRAAILVTRATATDDCARHEKATSPPRWREQKEAEAWVQTEIGGSDLPQELDSVPAGRKDNFTVWAEAGWLLGWRW